MTRALFIDNSGGVTQLLVFQLALILSSGDGGGGKQMIACKVAMKSKLVAYGFV